MTPALLALAFQAAHAEGDESSSASSSARAALARFEAHRATPAHLAQADGHGPACLTGLVAELRASLPSLPAAEQQEVLRLVEPWRQKWPADAPPPPDTCIGQYGENRLEGDHFSVEWDGNTISQGTAEDLLDALEYSWDVEVNDLGWIGPTGSSYYPILVYIEDSNYAGAYTSVLECSFGNYSAMPYIVAGKGSFYGGSWYKTMAAHEFNHASQFYYGYAHEFFWWEATATWMEEYVYPSLNDWSDPIFYGYSQTPYIAMNASDQEDEDIFWHMYAMAVWAFFLDEHVGGHDLVQDTWKIASDHYNTYYGLWMPDVIEEAGYEFDEIYPHFLAVAAVMDFEDETGFTLPVPQDRVEELPADGEDDEDERPQSLGQNFIKFDADAGAEDGVLEVTFDGEDGPEWFAVLAIGDDHELVDYVPFELDEDGAGTAQIAFDGGSNAYLIVSPMDEDSVGYDYNWQRADDWGYEWSAQLALPESEEDPGEGDDPDGDGDSDEESGLKTCGYTGGLGAMGLGWAAGLLALARRRR